MPSHVKTKLLIVTWSVSLKSVIYTDPCKFRFKSTHKEDAGEVDPYAPHFFLLYVPYVT